MEKYPSIRYPGESATDGLLAGDEVVVMEKLDGANFRWHFDADGTIVPGTRNVEYKSADDENIDGRFQHAIEYLQHQLRDIDTTHPLLQNLTFYGEAMHKHTIDYDAYTGEHPHPTEEDCPNVVVFDIMAHEGHPYVDVADEPERDGEFMNHNNFVGMMRQLPLTTAPVLGVYDVDNFDGVDIPTSEFRQPDAAAGDEFDRKGLAEGVVYKRGDGVVRAKKVHPEFKERHASEMGGGGPNSEPTKAGAFVSMYVTKARIRKIAHKLVDRPDTDWDGLSMAMMKDLPREVLRDAMAENGWDLLNNDFECEFDGDFKGSVRSKTSKKCARILKEEVATL